MRESGKILAGHNNCMAGMGKSCSHVGLLLWAKEAGVRLRGSMMPIKAYWVYPPVVKDIPHAKIEFQGKIVFCKHLCQTHPSQASRSHASHSPSPGSPQQVFHLPLLMKLAIS